MQSIINEWIKTMQNTSMVLKGFVLSSPPCWGSPGFVGHQKAVWFDNIQPWYELVIIPLDLLSGKGLRPLCCPSGCWDAPLSLPAAHLCKTSPPVPRRTCHCCCSPSWEPEMLQDTHQDLNCPAGQRDHQETHSGPWTDHQGPFCQTAPWKSGWPAYLAIHREQNGDCSQVSLYLPQAAAWGHKSNPQYPPKSSQAV